MFTWGIIQTVTASDFSQALLYCISKKQTFRAALHPPPPYKFLDSASEAEFYALVASTDYQRTYKSFDSSKS
ncbi:hypothetical protein FQN50_009617, partial [Emmonsiellopsis sp. PD_5]